MSLKRIVTQSDTHAGRMFDLFIQLLILSAVVCFTIGTLPNISTRNRQILEILEYVFVGVFSMEYLLRLFFADRKLKYVLSFYGLIDLVAILPFYLSLGFDLKAIRALRFLRIFRILKLVRYSRALERFHMALRIAKEELILFLFCAVILLYFSAVGIYYFENEAQPDVFSSIPESLWWAVATLTTVGYGDIYPITVGGKLFTFVILFIGLGIVAVPTGLIASSLSKAREIQTDKVD